jgi:hypothetical protein
MKLKTHAQVEWQRRAVLCGRAESAADRLTVEARDLWLCALDGNRCYRNQARPDGFYFFLDAPPGRYLLSRCDARGAVAGEKVVVLPVPRDGERHRPVSANLEDLPLPSPGHRHSGGKPV